jgi:RNA polymerase sigma factor (sigma-70 family)
MHRRWLRVERLDQPEAYVRKAIVREHLSWRRRRSNTETATVIPDDRPGGLPDASYAHAIRDELWRLLATLTRPQRVVLVLRFYEDLPDHRIAEILGCADVTVRVHASRGLAKLRASLPPAVAPATPDGAL